MVAGMDKEFHPHNGKQLSPFLWAGAAVVQEQMIGGFSLGNFPGPDQPTSVGWRRELVAIEPWSGWSTNSWISKNGKVKLE